ncbi:hypothetical protein DL95DRAFT_188086 [Leptodontidium sp. 2 PMI_412]|nr:hypothetical protein DL95DRAFT_188086 [Leptodontidium sp. 2 PMI_412]
MYRNAAVEQLVPSEFRVALASMGDEDLEAAFRYFQELPLSANSNSPFDSAPRIEAPLNVTPEQQDWSYGTAAHYTNPDGRQHPQAATFAHALSDNHSLYPATEQQDLYNEPAASGNNPSHFDFPSQSSTAQDPLLNSYEQDTTASMLDLEGIHFLDRGSFNTNRSPASSNTERSLSVNNFYQPSNTAYGTSITVQDLSPYSNLSPKTSFSPTTSSTPPHDHTSPTPSPTNASSPNATRSSCAHCPRNFARPSDLKRHAMIHFPERHRKYHCWQPDCDRNGRRGFTRKDKLRDHLRGVHELEEDELGI